MEVASSYTLTILSLGLEKPGYYEDVSWINCDPSCIVWHFKSLLWSCCEFLSDPFLFIPPLCICLISLVTFRLWLFYPELPPNESLWTRGVLISPLLILLSRLNREAIRGEFKCDPGLSVEFSSILGDVTMDLVRSSVPLLSAVERFTSFAPVESRMQFWWGSYLLAAVLCNGWTIKEEGVRPWGGYCFTAVETSLLSL